MAWEKWQYEAAEMKRQQMLLKRGANKDIADNQGYTALAFATSFNHTSVVQAPAAAPRRRPCHDLRLISPAPRQVLERPWLRVMEHFPPTLHRTRFGT